MLVRGTKDNIAQCSRHVRLVPEAEDTQPDFRLSSESGGIADVGELRIRAEADIRKCSYLPS
jgi:hypothetical protein